MKEFQTYLYLGILFLVVACSATIPKPEKINGVSFVASGDPIDESSVQPVVNVNANYAALMPFGFIKELSHPEIRFNSQRQWFGEREDGIKQYAQELRHKGIRIMLKPQLWVSHGQFTGFIKMENEENWKVLEDSYSKFILEYARIAQESNFEIFCIGTELENFIDARPDYWKRLIIEIKKVYKGKLTYASNWNEYNRTPFWDDIDYIGIDAYFPVDDKQSPTLEAAKTGWRKHKSEMHTYSEKHQKPILFTEFGYRSIDFSGRAPWTVDRIDKQVNLEAQAVLTQAILEEFWQEEWFAGGFVWKWFHDHENVGGKDDNRFTPQNKPSEEVLRTFYKNN
ncbi:MAG: glycoside hydrolase family 113 [Aquaticitalea sp.]